MILNIKVEYLPANSTSVLQSLDQRVIWSLKSYFKSNLIKYIITIIEDSREFKKNYYFQVAISLIQKSLSQVSEFTIRNCFNCFSWWRNSTSLGRCCRKIELKYEIFKILMVIDNSITITETINKYTIIVYLKLQNEKLSMIISKKNWSQFQLNLKQ